MPYFTENTPSAGQSKIALQGAVTDPEDPSRITLFSWFPVVSSVLRCMPPGASIPSRSCQEQCFPPNKAVFSTQLFLWFAPTLAESLDS